VRYGNTSSFFFFDGRDDARDFPANGAFPGNFAAAPFAAAIGAAGFLGSNPQHAAAPYPSKSYAVTVRAPIACPRDGFDRLPAAIGRPRHHTSTTDLKSLHRGRRIRSGTSDR